MDALALLVAFVALAVAVLANYRLDRHMIEMDLEADDGMVMCPVCENDGDDRGYCWKCGGTGKVDKE